jgi:hypothetical protein
MMGASNKTRSRGRNPAPQYYDDQDDSEVDHNQVRLGMRR